MKNIIKDNFIDVIGQLYEESYLVLKRYGLCNKIQIKMIGEINRKNIIKFAKSYFKEIKDIRANINGNIVDWEYLESNKVYSDIYGTEE